jgi:hypothetical protein
VAPITRWKLISVVWCVISDQTRASRFAFVSFVDPASVQQAMSLNGSTLVPYAYVYLHHRYPLPTVSQAAWWWSSPATH